MRSGKIIKIAGPLVVAEGMTDAKVYEVVHVSDKKLIGEIIELKGDKASIQVYEETGGLKAGEPVVPSGMSLSVDLGPGLIGAIYDGIQRPLNKVYEKAGNVIPRGVSVSGLDEEKKWNFVPSVKTGDRVSGGNTLGTVQETELIVHKVMVPPGLEGEIKSVSKGQHTITDTVAELKTKDGVLKLTMMQRWPVRKVRPYAKKLIPGVPLVTGQRVIDMFFPVSKGGTACVPGPFGSGKTVIQHQLAKWADAKIIVYVGCGERGNEMTDVLQEFPELKDPRSGRPLMERTVLIANTSNMPVAAREASVYTGITIAEYFRDMGYDVALMADSTSRWAEAMREMSGRLEEMPGEEGYPAYLPSRIAGFYERAGLVKPLGQDDAEGSLSVIGAVSPPGGDLSDAVVQATLKVVKVFWSLEDKLAFERHFPAISWLNSYSLYHDNLSAYFGEKVNPRWVEHRVSAMGLLQKEAELKELVRLVGLDSISAQDRLVLDTAKLLREDFLHQIAFDPVDTYSLINKQFMMLDVILHFYKEASMALSKDVPVLKIVDIPVRDEISKMRYIEDKNVEKFGQLKEKISEQLSELK